MVEIHLKLGFEAIQALVCGEEVPVVVDEEELLIVLVASDEAQKRFEENTQKVVLALAQAGPSRH